MSLVQHLRNPWVAALASAVVLVGMYFIRPQWWTYYFAILLAFVIADVVKGFFLAGGNGLAQVPALGTQIQARGHAFLVFLLYIAVGTVASGFLAEKVTARLIGVGKWYPIVANSLIVGLVFLDMWISFYKRR